MAIIKQYLKYLRRTFIIGSVLFVLVSISLVVPLRWVPPVTSAFMWTEQLITEEKPQYDWVPLKNMSPCMGIAVIASEDQKFPNHYGFDLESIAREMNKDSSRRRGASTITQQVAKNLYLWNGRSYLRKGLEAYMTVLLETFLPKRRILEIYLNIAEFGPGVYGVGAASRTLLEKSPRDLSSVDCTVLAAVLPSPKRMSVAKPSPYVRKRASQIRAQVYSLGGTRYLSQLD